MILEKSGVPSWGFSSVKEFKIRLKQKFKDNFKEMPGQEDVHLGSFLEGENGEEKGKCHSV